MEKVFCNKCKYLYLFDVWTCTHIDNKFVDNWFCERGMREASPKSINRNNNCKWFKSKYEGCL